MRDVTGHFDSGKLMMIIGPSGAGKTTMLKIVSGERLSNVKGTIMVNGVVQNKRTAFRKQVCYVPQKFSLLPLLTVKETLYIAALFKLDVERNKQTIYPIVSERNLRRVTGSVPLRFFDEFHQNQIYHFGLWRLLQSKRARKHT